MNTNTGGILPLHTVLTLPEPEREKHIPMDLPPTPKQLKRGRVGRNDPCPCGSGRKFKRCHYRPA